MPGMGEGSLLVGFVTLQRLAELAFAHRNTRLLLGAGGIEFGRASTGRRPNRRAARR
jgi:isoprenylcysteine carboxyl methyltransferase (ICMT) family protein YpbQ